MTFAPPIETQAQSSAPSMFLRGKPGPVQLHRFLSWQKLLRGMEGGELRLAKDQGVLPSLF